MTTRKDYQEADWLARRAEHALNAGDRATAVRLIDQAEQRLVKLEAKQRRGQAGRKDTAS